jgi:hypothetical protein
MIERLERLGQFGDSERARKSEGNRGGGGRGTHFSRKPLIHYGLDAFFSAKTAVFDRFKVRSFHRDAVLRRLALCTCLYYAPSEVNYRQLIFE